MIKKAVIDSAVGDDLAASEEAEGTEAVLDGDKDDLVADVLEELLELDLRIPEAESCAQGQS